MRDDQRSNTQAMKPKMLYAITKASHLRWLSFPVNSSVFVDRWNAFLQFLIKLTQKCGMHKSFREVYLTSGDDERETNLIDEKSDGKSLLDSMTNRSLCVHHHLHCYILEIILLW